MLIIQLINLLLFGFAVGILGTYIGVGGGFLHVPTLLYFYGASPQQAIGTSLVVVFTNALSGTINYAKQKRVDYRSGWVLAAATVPGAIAGVYLTRYFNLHTFTSFFGIFLIGVSLLTFIRPFLDAAKKKKRPAADSSIPGVTPVKKSASKFTVKLKDAMGYSYNYSYNIKIATFFSVFIGLCSSLLGVGGGIFHVPALIHMFNFPTHIATATSHFMLVISALAGAVFHYMCGNILLLPAIAMSAGTIFGAQIGANLSKRSKPVWIMLVLGLVLFVVGFQMIQWRPVSNNLKRIPSFSSKPGQGEMYDTSLGAKGALTNIALNPAAPAANAVTRATPPMSQTTPGVEPPPSVNGVAPHAVTAATPKVSPPASGKVQAVTQASPKFLPSEKLLGADIVNVDTVIAKQFNLPVAQGVLVNDVAPGSGAEAGGLKRGDIIVKFEATRVRDVNHMERLVTGEQVGEKIDIRVIRNGQPRLLFIQIGEKPATMMREQVAVAAKAGIHLGYVIMIMSGVFLFLIHGRLEKSFVVVIGAIAIVWVGTVHGFYDIGKAIDSIYWNTLALLLGMNIISAVLAESGFFTYIAKVALLVTKGSKGLLLVIFCVISYVLSCFVNNLSAIVIILPILFSLTRALDFDPRPHIIAIIIASNFGGASTMVGDFPNMIIGSQVNIPFHSFIVYMMPLNIIMLVLLIVYIRFYYKHLERSRNRDSAYDGQFSKKIRLATLLASIRKQLKEIKLNKPAVIKTAAVLFCIFATFLMSDYLEISPALIALLGGGAALAWSGVSVKAALKRIQFRDLIFFLALFVLVGGVNALGFLDLAAQKMVKTAGGNALALNLFLMWGAAAATCFLNAGPTTAVFLPIVQNFTLHAPHYLFWWSLSLGVCAGSSGTLTGATAGPVSATMYDYFLKREKGRRELTGGKNAVKKFKKMRLTFMQFAKVGLPVMVGYLLIASAYIAWLYSR